MNKTKLMFVLLASLVLGACSSSSDDDGDNSKKAAYTETVVSEAPTWQIDWRNNQQRPNWMETWTQTDFPAIYENWTILKVQLEEELRPYVSENDMLALFVNGELRGLANPAVIVGNNQMLDDGKFVMKAWGNETEAETVNMTLQYYSQTLKHIFTLSGDITLDSDETIGIDEDYIPEFTYGSAKYPVTKMVTVESILNVVGITPVGGNMVGAFVGNECRGTTTLSVNGGTSLLIFGRNNGEMVTLQYYDVSTRILYTIPNIVKL